MNAKKAAESPREPAKSESTTSAAQPAEASVESNAERPLEGTGLGVGNPWDAAYGSNVPPKRDAAAVPPAEETHLGTMADPTPRDEYTVSGVTAKQAAADKQKES